MDPRYQDETFASTVSGIEELRGNAGEDRDWLSWKRVLIASANAGRVLEQRVNDAEVAIETKLARRSAVSELSNRVAALEGSARRRRGVLNWIINHFWQLAVIGLAAALAHTWH